MVRARAGEKGRRGQPFQHTTQLPRTTPDILSDLATDALRELMASPASTFAFDSLVFSLKTYVLLALNALVKLIDRRSIVPEFVL